MRRKNTTSAGNRRENQVKELLEGRGWTVKKTRVSKSPIDLVARKGPQQLLIQVKANTGSPWKNFSRKDRIELLDELSLYGDGTTAWLVHWMPHGTCDWYSTDIWALTTRGHATVPSQSHPLSPSWPLASPVRI